MGRWIILPIGRVLDSGKNRVVLLDSGINKPGFLELVLDDPSRSSTRPRSSSLALAIVRLRLFHALLAISPWVRLSL